MQNRKVLNISQLRQEQVNGEQLYQKLVVILIFHYLYSGLVYFDGGDKLEQNLYRCFGVCKYYIPMPKLVVYPLLPLGCPGTWRVQSVALSHLCKWQCRAHQNRSLCCCLVGRKNENSMAFGHAMAQVTTEIVVFS